MDDRAKEGGKEIDGERLRLDPQSQAVCLGDRRTVMQYKVWGVLTALIDAAPKMVTRAELIDTIWNGNYEIGEKALSQAVWSIRSALGDEAKAPTFIKTAPRAGYQWIARPPEQTCTRPAPERPNRLPSLMVATMAVFLLSAAMIAAMIPRLSADGAPPYAHPSDIVSAANGTSARFNGANIIVDHFEGCRIVLRPSRQKRLMSPVISADDGRIAVQVREAEDCSLVVLEFKTRERIDFGACPTVPPTTYTPNNIT